jgi:predicted nucleotidyltransferase
MICLKIMSFQSASLPESIRFSEERLAGFCKRHNIRKLSFFGSVLSPEFSAHSDLDVLVEFEPGHVPGFIRLARMERELTQVFNGRKVDLRTREDLSRYFRDEVVSRAEVFYEQK